MRIKETGGTIAKRTRAHSVWPGHPQPAGGESSRHEALAERSSIVAATALAVVFSLAGARAGASMSIDFQGKCAMNKIKVSAKLTQCYANTMARCYFRGVFDHWDLSGLLGGTLACLIPTNPSCMPGTPEPIFDCRAQMEKCRLWHEIQWGKQEAKAQTYGVDCPGDVESAENESGDYVRGAFSGVSAQHFIDNGDGTITDNTTGLQWEKKGLGSGCLHCVADTMSWWSAMGDWVSQVNGWSEDGSLGGGLAGHSDWRLPTTAELQTLLVEPAPCVTHPCVDPVMGPTATTYWTSVTWSSSSGVAFFVSSYNGALGLLDKSGARGMAGVRAVRGGS